MSAGSQACLTWIVYLANPASVGRRGGRVVYCGGLENRFGFTADGGSNPSLSAISTRRQGRTRPCLEKQL
jgi:hypothetical protein